MVFLMAILTWWLARRLNTERKVKRAHRTEQERRLRLLLDGANDRTPPRVAALPPFQTEVISASTNALAANAATTINQELTGETARKENERRAANTVSTWIAALPVPHGYPAANRLPEADANRMLYGYSVSNAPRATHGNPAINARPAANAYAAASARQAASQPRPHTDGIEMHDLDSVHSGDSATDALASEETMSGPSSIYSREAPQVPPKDDEEQRPAMPPKDDNEQRPDVPAEDITEPVVITRDFGAIQERRPVPPP